MFEQGLYKVEEIGVLPKPITGVFLKGRGRSFFEREELVRCLFTYPHPECQREIASLIDGRAEGEALFARNVLRLAQDPVTEVKITQEEIEKGQKVKPFTMHSISSLRFSDGRTISKLIPHDGLKLGLASMGIGDGVDIYCHRNLYDGKSQFIRFKKIEDIKIRDENPETYVDEDEYEELEFDQVMMTFPDPKSIVYKNDSKEYLFAFPKDKVTIKKAWEDLKKINKNLRWDPDKWKITFYDSPVWEAKTVTVIDDVIRNANIEVDSVFIDARLGHYRTDDRSHKNVSDYRASSNILGYEAVGAVIVLRKDGKKMVTPCPGYQGIGLAFLHDKNIRFRDLAKPQAESYLA